MTSNRPRTDNFDALMTAWLDADARGRHVDDDLLAGVLARTSRTRPLPAWRIPERWIPMQLALRLQPRIRFSPVLVVIALTIVAVVAAIIYAGSLHRLPPPFGIADNGRIAFVNGTQLVTENPDGTGLTVIAASSALPAAPSFSRDGTKIAYKTAISAQVDPVYGPAVDILVANADGSSPKVVVHDTHAGNPLWSPDGHWLTYSSGAAGGARAYVVPADGSSAPVDLGDFGGAEPWTPNFAPDSSKLAVAVGDGTLWIVNRDGSNAHAISHEDFVEIGEKGLSADWSPDGTKLLFGGMLTDHNNLYMVGLDGASERIIAANANNGVWSPDGSMFAYMLAGIGQGPSLVVADRTGKTIRVLDGYYGWYMPEWSPDQTRIAILDDRPGPTNDNGLPPEIVLLDPLGVAKPVIIPAGDKAITEETSPDITLTWQRLAP
jgi:Tol biopolymer transport system component